MKPRLFGAALLLWLVATPALADTVILRDGASYNGQFTPRNGEIAFSDSQGIQYKFPVRDVQSLVFSSTTDIVTLRSGKIYSGQYGGPDALSFQDSQGIQYQFPLKDVETLVLTQTDPPPNPSGVPAKVVPHGTEVVIRSDEAIDSNNASPGQLFAATVREDVPDSVGGVAIPGGSSAKLVVRNITSGGAVHSPELIWTFFP